MKVCRSARRSRLGARLLLPLMVATLGAGATPLVLCHLPGDHLAVEFAAATCAGLPAAMRAPVTASGFSACGTGFGAHGCLTASRGCLDTPLSLTAVLGDAAGPVSRFAAAVAPIAVPSVVLRLTDRQAAPTQWWRAAIFLPPRSPVLLA